MKIKKGAIGRRDSTLNPFLKEFITKATATPIEDLPNILKTFPYEWPWPRGDLHHWVPLLDLFDTILEDIVRKYNLKDGPQTTPFEVEQKGVLLAVLDFSRMLVENCGNRNLYASSAHLGELLNTTDLDVLYSTLYLSLRLAQRYHTSRTRGSSTSNVTTLLASHYNINLDRVQKITSAFPKALHVGDASKHGSPSKATLPVFVSDIGRIARGEEPSVTGEVKGKGKAPAQEFEGSWEDFGSAWISFYKTADKTTLIQPPVTHHAPPVVREPVTPTPNRRSTLHHSHTPTQQTPSSASRRRGGEEEAAEVPVAPAGGLTTLEVSAGQIKSATNLEAIIEGKLPEIPDECKYEFLHRLRIASAMLGGADQRRKILAIRILAIANLAYIHPEPAFITKVLATDSDEPRRLQLVYQLAEFLQGSQGSNQDSDIPRWLQTISIITLEAFARHKSRVSDVSSALSLNVNHGLLLYLLRKLVVELQADSADSSEEAHAWRDALFNLILYLPVASPTGTFLVSAGLLPLLVDILNIRSELGRRYIPKTITLLDQIIYAIPTAFQAFATAKGLDAIVDLVSYETTVGLQEVEEGKGVPAEYRSEQTDYQITHLRQQTLKMSAKLMQHIMSQSGANADRLLRNLVDNPKLLEAIRVVISRGNIWGSSIWSTIVQMISAFIHNEPTSYAVVHEAHITHALLETITGQTGLAEKEAAKKKADEEKAAAEAAAPPRTGPLTDEEFEQRAAILNALAAPSASSAPTEEKLEEKAPEEKTPEKPARIPAAGIMPSHDAISCIPTALGAICLNAAGLNLIQLSNALNCFFEIFESPTHVKVLIESELHNLLGSQFDELIRHHPPLRNQVLNSMIAMLEKIQKIGFSYAEEHGVGAKIWLEDENGVLTVAGGRQSINGMLPTDVDRDGDAVMSDLPAPQEDKVTLAEIFDEEAEGADKKMLPIVNFIDAAGRFVEGIIQNHTQSKEFVKLGGLELLLNFYTIPSLPHTFATSQANTTICQCLHYTMEHAVEDTLRTVFTAADQALGNLETYLQHQKKEAFFDRIVDPSLPDAPKGEYDIRLKGTKFIKSLTVMHSMTYLLQDLFNQVIFGIKTSVKDFLEKDIGIDRQDFIRRLGMLQRQCVWEEILLQNAIPQSWDIATRVRESVSTAAAVAIEENKDVEGGLSKEKDDKKDDEKAIQDRNNKTAWFRNVKTVRYLIGQIPTTINPFLQGLARCVIPRRVPDMLFKYLAFKVVDSISDVIKDHLTWDRIETADVTTQKYGFQIVMLSSIMSLLLENIPADYFLTKKAVLPENLNISILTATVVMFKQKDGLQVVSKILEQFWGELKELPPADEASNASLSELERSRLMHAYAGIRIILSMFSYLVSAKCVTQGSQSITLASRPTDPQKQDYFNPAQLLVELRYIILPVVREMWKAQELEGKASSGVSKTVIEILGAALHKGEEENGAFTRAMITTNKTLNNILSYERLTPHEERVKRLVDMGYPAAASRQALLRCNDNIDDAVAMLSSTDGVIDRMPPLLPGDHEDSDASDDDEDGEGSGSEDDDADEDDEQDGDEEEEATAPPAAPEPPVDAAATAPATSEPAPAEAAPVLAPQVSEAVPPAEGPDAELAVAPPPPAPVAPAAPALSTPTTRIDINDLLSPVPPAPALSQPAASATADATAPAPTSETTEEGKDKPAEEAKEEPKPEKENPFNNICIDDLDEMREEIRDQLIERCLEVINKHPDTTFELADLIRSAFGKSPADAKSQVVSTILLYLVSIQVEDDCDFRPRGKMIASTAHLLGLILQDQTFYEAGLDELKEYFQYLVAFIKTHPGHTAPWISTVLLILEKILAESSQIEQVKFDKENPEAEAVVEITGIKIELDDQIALFDNIMNILPDVQRDEVLSITISRVLVILTRKREIAAKLMENNNLRKVLHMYRRQAGNRVDKLQSSLMIMLRHIVEDDETIRSIMRAEIRNIFAAAPARSRGQAAQVDLTSFTKSTAYLVVRNPDLYVEVVNELCKLVKYDKNLRNQGIILKEAEKKPEAEEQNKEGVEEKKAEGEEAEEDKEKDKVATAAPAATEAPVDDPMEIDEKPKTITEIRAPGVEHPDGVVHFLLIELFAIKDVRDIGPTLPSIANLDVPMEGQAPAATGPQPLPAGQTPGTLQSMFPARPAQSPGNSATPTPAPGVPAPVRSVDGVIPVENKTDGAKTEKQEYKAESHPYFFYRTFILMALAELLCCYNRCKVEFINFNRKSGGREPITPSKPRSAVFNYLLNDIIAQQTLNIEDELDKKKKRTLAEWAQGVFVSLCTHTGENNTEDEPDLLFVRKFVCETSLKAFKDACASSESLDIKYARMMSLSEAFYRILCGRPQTANTYSTAWDKTQMQMAKIMLDKHYVQALTGALADIDLNFPDASKKYIKYMLKTLRLLSKRAIDLSDSDMSTLGGTTDEDEILTASSMTDIDDIREETPDLYRHSTLGLFEGGEMGDDEEGTDWEEEDEDEEMYDEFEDEMPEEGDSEASDEEDEEGEGGPHAHEWGEGGEIELVVDGEDGDDDSDDEDSDMDDEEDMMDEDDAEIIIEDHNHHNHGYDDEDGLEDQWESDDEDDEGEEGDEDEDGLMAGSLARDIVGDGHDILQLQDEDREGHYHDEDDLDEEDMEDDDMVDEMDEEDDMMEEEDYDEDDEGESALPWGWADGDGEPIIARGHPRGVGGMFTLSGASRDPPFSIAPAIQSRGARSSDFDSFANDWETVSFASRGALRNTRPYHPGQQDRTRDLVNANPLLQQANDENAPARRIPLSRFPPDMHDFVTAMDGMSPLNVTGGPASVINTLMNLMSRNAGPGNVIQFQASIPRGHGLPQGMHRELRTMFGGFRPTDPSRHRTELENVMSTFEAAMTSVRWTEEMRLLFSARAEDNAQRIINTLLHKLVPLALKEEKIRKDKEEALKKKLEEEQEARRKKEEEERLAKEKAEAEEKAKKEEEERKAAEKVRLEAEARAAEATETGQAEGTAATTEGEANPTGESTTETAAETTENPPAEAGPSEPVERATVTIRDQEIDITGLGIDPEFLAAIPEDMREEALTAYIRERRAEAATENQSSEISPEFLEALPEEIREELLAQENADRRRREQDAARTAGGAGGPADIDLASFLATLEPTLRQTVLLEQDDDALAQLPQDIVEEANQLRQDRGYSHHHYDRVRVVGGIRPPRPVEEPQPKKQVRKGTIQLLDKSGVATILRLMFIPQPQNTRGMVSEILLNICENRQNRAEVINQLLAILQDGSSDMAAVERTFHHLTMKAKTGPTLQKTPVKPGLERRGTSSSVLAQTNGEISPLMVTQQCLGALFFLVRYNEHIPSYFLTEHDISGGLKRSLSRKGKGKQVDTKASKYALNTLLGLLDRPLITESTSIMEQLSTILSDITRPLTILLKKDKKKIEEDKLKEAEEVTGEQAAAAAPAAEASGEQQPAAAVAEQSTAEHSTAEMTSEAAPAVGAPVTEAPVTEAPADGATDPSAEAAPETTEPGAAGPSTAGHSTEKPKPVEEEKLKKPTRQLIPPVVPEHNLRLVVNILTARECSGKTFRETIATIQNLSGIPGAKEVFGVELIRQAQELGSVLLGHLDGLLQQIKKAESGTQVQGMALASFSPASSEQAKLLRVLTALDYLFDPKRTAKHESVEEKEKKEGEEKEEPDVLAKLHQSLSFAPLWGKLSECLAAIHEREDMLHIATILLPSIEALMVVCKSSGLDEKDSKTTPAAEASANTRKLFFTFTEDHRKILNQMVRNNPKLMSGSFALLVNNPKVLDFDNKRNYFSRKLHTRSLRDAHPTLQLNVRRDQVFMDSYRSMYYKSGDEIKYAKLSIRFANEEGVDAGGVTREWFQVMARQMFNPMYALFVPVAGDRTTFHPNHLSGVNSEHLQFFKFIGRIIGKALYEGRVLDCHFSRAVYKRILGKSVSLKDMETLDLEYYKSMVWMCENDITDIIVETFSVEVDEFGANRTVDLIPDGRNIAVTEENKHEYVRLMTEHKLLASVKEQLDAFLTGFYDIVPANLISIFSEQELELLISGMPEIDMDDWKNNTEYHNYSASSPQIQWFWRAVRSFDKEERAKLLQFVTGTSKVPLNGFKELEGMNGFSKFNIHRDYGNKDRLPSSHTCFNQLDLPEYESYETLRQQVLTAITQGAEYFGFA